MREGVADVEVMMGMGGEGWACLHEMVRARVRACARGNAAFAPFPYRAWPLRVAVHNPASRGKRACGRACGRACVVCALYCSPWGGLRRARAVLRASRVMREAVHARVRRSASFAPFPYRV